MWLVSLRDLSVVTRNILVIRIGENYVGCFQNSYSEPYKRAPLKKWCQKHSHRTMEFSLNDLLLNSANSVNHDQIQEQYGYQRYYPSGNRYIVSASNTKCVFITAQGRHLLSLTTQNRYQPTDSSGKLLFTTI